MGLPPNTLRHGWSLLPIAIAAALPLAPAGTSTSIEAAAAPVTLAFEYTGAEQTFVVPEGVSGQAIFDIYGAQGGNRDFSGGLGGRAVSTFPVSPGQTYYLYVGGQGGDVDAPTTNEVE